MLHSETKKTLSNCQSIRDFINDIKEICEQIPDDELDMADDDAIIER